MTRPIGAGARGRRAPSGKGAGLTGTMVIHVAIGGVLWTTAPGAPVQDIRVYAVRLVAAPAPEPDRPRPEIIERQAPVQPAVPSTRPPRNAPSPAEPPPPPDPDVTREPTPRAAPDEAPNPDVDPSTGSDPGTVEVPGVDFPFAGYLRNIVAQVYRRWSRPSGNVPYRAEVLFFIRRDGSIANFQFTTRSGNLAFDLRAQGAVEAAGNARAFGPLPEGYENDVLPVSFFFDPTTLGQR